jgi:hypothetical protein
MSKNIYNPNSHFFVDYLKLADPVVGDYTITKDQNDVETITTNTEGNYDKDAFGPVKVKSDYYNNTNKFRTTSFVRAINITDKVDVFAICDGDLLILEQEGVGNENKINIVLKPRVSFAPLNIKYFIYRGVNKDSLFDENSNLRKVFDDSSSSPVLLKKVWTDYLNYNQPDYLKKGGLIENTDKVISMNKLTCMNSLSVDGISDDTLIENVFQRNISVKEFQLVPCNKGSIIGQFSGRVGLDIVLDDGDYRLEHEEQLFKLDLGFARKNDYKFDIAQFQNNAGKVKKYKEHIHSFLDAAAFWGSHIDSGEIILNGQTKNSSNTEIYSNILIKYQTAFNIYTYIKKERNRTLSFKENKLITFENAQQYVNPCNNWPIYISKIIRSSTSLSPLLQIKIPYKIDTLISESEINIFWKCFTSTNTDKDSIYLKEENLVKSNITPYLTIREEETLDNKAIKFKYLKINNTIYSTSNFIIISTIYNQELTFKSFYNYLWCANICPLNSFDLKKIVSATLITNNLINLHPIIGVNGTCLQQKVVFDYGKNINSETKKRRLFISSISDVFIDKKEENTILISKGIKSNSTEVSSKAEYYKALYDSDLTHDNSLEKVSVFKGKVEDNGTIINTLTLISDTDYKIADRYFQLGITDDEYNKLFFNSSTIEDTLYIPITATNIYFTLDEIEIDYSKEYRKFKLGLSFESADGNSRETKYPSNDNQVSIYSIDDKFYFSKDYSDYQIYFEEFANAKVEFRTMLTDVTTPRIIKKYKGEFGFDWLRIGDNGEKAYKDVVIGGYDGISENDTDNNMFEGVLKDTIIENLYNLNNVENFNFPNITTPSPKAYRALKKEYPRIPTLQNSTFYYVPYLNIFPKTFADKHPENRPPDVVNLRILIEISEDYDRLEYEYDSSFFQLNKSVISEKNITSGKIQSIDVAIQITCIKEFHTNKQIRVYAFSSIGNEKKIAGSIVILKNSISNINYINLVYNTIKTNINNIIKEGFYYPDEIQMIRNSIYQTLNYPTILIYPPLVSNNIESPKKNTINLSNNNEYKINGKFIYSINPEPEPIPDKPLHKYGGIIVSDDLFNDLNEKFTQVTDSNLDSRDYSNYIKVYSFSCESFDYELYGRAQNFGSKNILLFSEIKLNLATNINEDLRPIMTTAHELLHLFYLRHTHFDSDKNNISLNSAINNYQKYIFPKDILLNYEPSRSYIDNILSYNMMSYSTWRWQWEIFNKNKNLLK